MNIAINNNVPTDLHLPGAGVDWKPKDANATAQLNFGKLLSVETTDDGRLVAQTENGTLTLNVDKPVLEASKKNVAMHELPSFGDDAGSLKTKGGVSMLEIGMLIMEAEKQRRKTNREVRHISRDAAFTEANSAADKLEAAAKKSLGMGIAAGIFSIAGGVVGVAGGLKSLGKSVKDLKGQSAQGKFNAELAGNSSELGKVKGEIAQLKKTPEGQSNAAAKAKLALLEGKETKLQKTQDKILGKIDARIKDLDEMKMAKSDKLDEIDDGIVDLKRQPQPLSEADTAKLNTLEAKRTDVKEGMDSLQYQIDGLKTTKANGQKVASGISDAETDAWLQTSKIGGAEINSQIQTIQMMTSGIQALTGAAASIAQTVGQTNESAAQADAKRDDADVAKANFEQEEANASVQDANRAISQFLEAWSRMMDTVKATQDRLVQA